MPLCLATLFADRHPYRKRHLVTLLNGRDGRYDGMIRMSFRCIRLNGVNAVPWLGDMLSERVDAWPLKQPGDLLRWPNAYARALIAIAPRAQSSP